MMNLVFDILERKEEKDRGGIEEGKRGGIEGRGGERGGIEGEEG